MKVQQCSRGGRSPEVFQVEDLPPRIRALDALPSDYADVFTAATAGAGAVSAERWARAALEEASALGRFVAWRALLGLRLGPRRSPEHVAGWRIAGSGDDWIRIEARSWFMTANIVFQVEPGEVSLATLVRYDNPVARLVWTPVSAVHRQVAPGVLRDAVARVGRHR